MVRFLPFVDVYGFNFYIESLKECYCNCQDDFTIFHNIK